MNRITQNHLPIQPLERQSSSDLEKTGALPGERNGVVDESVKDGKVRYHYSGKAAREQANLKRSLTARHLAMLALASGIGTGLFLGSGSALATAGPLGVLLGYAAMGLVTAGIAFISAETAAFLPISGGFIRVIPMFTDKALGITTGYTFWYLLAITAPAEIVAASSLVGYWRPDLNLAIWISIFIAVIFVFNLLPVRFYGEIEFGLGLLKILLVIGLILAGLIVDWGGSPSGQFIGGKNWHPDPIKEYLVSGSTGRFLAFWSTLTNAAFALGNIQIATSVGSECKNPRVDVPKAMRRVFVRILIFYLASLLVVGLILNSNDPRIGMASGTAGSPFVLAFQTARIKALPSIINAVVITSAFSSGNGVLFLASRTLLGLASDGFAPKIFLKVNRFGAPYAAVVVSSLFLPLAYLNCGSSTPATVFGWFINLISIAGLNVWVVICIAYLRFYYGLKKQGINRNELPYKSRFQPYAGYATGLFSFLVVFFSGFSVFFPGNFSASDFLSNYINTFIMIALYIILKFTIKSPWIKTSEMDFSEMAAIREERSYSQDLVVDPIKKRPLARRILEKFTDE